MGCYAEAEGKYNLELADPEKVEQARQDIKNYCGNLRDKYTPFRFFTHVIKYGRGRKNKDCNITNEYLLQVWENQKGICPHTGWKLILPDTTDGWKTGHTTKSASLDRIDNSKGYIEGNVRFVAYMSNIARNRFDDEDLFEFCKAVTQHRK